MGYGDLYMNTYPMQNQTYPMPMQDRLSQLQSQYQQMVPRGFNNMQGTVQPMYLNGQMVDSIDVVKAKDVDMTGAVTYYPKADLTEIYTKQLQPNGMSRIVTYKAVPEELPEHTPQQITMDMINNLIGQMKTDLLNEISGIKEMVGNLSIAEERPSTKTAKGVSKQ